MKKWFAQLATWFFLLNSVSVAMAAESTVWLAGDDPVVQAQKHKSEPADYMDLFKADSPWPNATRRVAAFKISMQFALRSSEEQLTTLIDDLRRRHIALAIEMGLISGPGPNQCGMNIEGYSSPTGPENAAKRIKAHGGQLDYVAMDEPVWFGHHFGEGSGRLAGKRGCQYSLPELVDKIAPQIEMLRRYFPNIRVGDIEPISSKWGGKSSIDDFVAFDELLRKRLSNTPVFFHADIAWAIPGWKPLLEDAAGRLRRDGIRIGVICDGDETVGTNEAWVRQALERCSEVQSDPRIDPDDLIVQSWEKLPTRMLPESDPGSLTFEALQVSRAGQNRGEGR